MLYIKLFIEREKNTGQSAPECPFNSWENVLGGKGNCPGELSWNMSGGELCGEMSREAYSILVVVNK